MKMKCPHSPSSPYPFPRFFLLDPDAAILDHQCATDVNQDGGVDGRDIQAFVNSLLMR